MAKGAYIGGTDNLSKKIKKIYIGDDSGNSRKVKKAYIGDENGKSRLFWSGSSKESVLLVKGRSNATNGSYSISNNDGKSFTTSSNTFIFDPEDKSSYDYISSAFKGDQTYGNGVFVSLNTRFSLESFGSYNGIIFYFKFAYSNDSGKTWHLDSQNDKSFVINGFTEDLVGLYPQVHFINNKFYAFIGVSFSISSAASNVMGTFTYYSFSSDDGINWTLLYSPETRTTETPYHTTISNYKNARTSLNKFGYNDSIFAREISIKCYNVKHNYTIFRLHSQSTSLTNPVYNTPIYYDMTFIVPGVFIPGVDSFDMTYAIDCSYEEMNRPLSMYSNRTCTHDDYFIGFESGITLYNLVNKTKESFSITYSSGSITLLTTEIAYIYTLVWKDNDLMIKYSRNASGSTVYGIVIVKNYTSSSRTFHFFDFTDLGFTTVNGYYNMDTEVKLFATNTYFILRGYISTGTGTAHELGIKYSEDGINWSYSSATDAHRNMFLYADYDGVPRGNETD